MCSEQTHRCHGQFSDSTENASAYTYLITVQLIFADNLHGDLLACLAIPCFVHIRESTATAKDVRNSERDELSTYSPIFDSN